ncbi:hypothetical protein [Candidatus Photodesmus blepharus]|uniref:hypothetical protein n=1 Tax=Candidatus Photodesmus blepharonis TaxID=1179155 RepID=UPI0012DDE72E|nr:hypothetical protein [Candidatus Photodesmus blepharus]
MINTHKNIDQYCSRLLTIDKAISYKGFRNPHVIRPTGQFGFAWLWLSTQY